MSDPEIDFDNIMGLFVGDFDADVINEKAKNDPDLDVDEGRLFTVGELIERLSAFPTESRVAVFGHGERIEVWHHAENGKVALTGVGY